MNEVDIKGQCTELQANKVIQLVQEGWEAVGILDGEMVLKKPGCKKWVKENGDDYPRL